MKKLFTVGFGLMWASLMPACVWILMGQIYGTGFSNGFTYTYPYQFVFLFFASVLFAGNVKHELKNVPDTEDFGRSGVFVFFAASLFVTVFSILNIDIIGPFLGITDDIGRLAFSFGLCSMTVDWTAHYMGERLQFHGREAEGARFITSWYAFKLALCVSTAVPVFTCKTAVLFILTIQALVLAVLLYRVRPKHFRFSLRNGIRYSIGSLTEHLFLGLVFFIGIHDIAITDASFLAALNLTALCSDTQWDVIKGAIDIAVTEYACSGHYEKHSGKILRTNLIFSGICTMTCFLMAGTLIPMYPDVDGRLALLILVAEGMCMPVYGLFATWEAYVAIIRPTPLIAAAAAIKYVSRFLAQIFIPSVWAISLGIHVSYATGLPMCFWLYKQARKTGRASADPYVE